MIDALSWAALGIAAVAVLAAFVDIILRWRDGR